MIRAQTQNMAKSLFFAAILVSGLYVIPVNAQSADYPVLHTGHAAENHYCGTDTSSPDALRHVEAYLEARRNGTLGALAKSSSPPSVGDERSFNVFESAWMPLNFRAVDVTSAYVLWVEIDELNNGNVTPSEVAGLRTAIFDETPAASINPDAGFLPNINSVFGQPPNVDGDGLVDILMYDIGRGSSNTLGYVSAADVNPQAVEGQGNGRDVLYLDSDQGTSNLTTLAAIAAHEYTHLVNLSYGWDTTFLNEGFAEYAMVLNGYFWRNIRFLANRTEYTRTLFDWRDGGGPGAVDYERAGLFVTYIANLVGPEGVAAILTGRNLKGARGIDSVMTDRGSSLAELLQDYHTSILYNDRTIDPAFGFQEQARSSIRISLAGLEVDGEVPSTAGEGGFQTISQNQSVNSGSVQYYRWRNVADFSILLETPGWRIFPAALQEQQRATLYGRNSARVVLEPADGSALQFIDMAPGSGTHTFDGSFASITLIASHLNPEAVPGDQIEFEAFWTPRSMATDIESAPLPEAATLHVFPNPVSGPATLVSQIERPGAYRAELFDVLGRRVWDQVYPALLPGPLTQRVPTSGLPPGLYLVRLSGSGMAISTTLTVAR